MAKCPRCGEEGIPDPRRTRKDIICSKCGKSVEWYHFIDWDIALKIWEEAEEEGIKMDRGR